MERIGGTVGGAGALAMAVVSLVLVVVGPIPASAQTTSSSTSTTSSSTTTAPTTTTSVTSSTTSGPTTTVPPAGDGEAGDDTSTTDPLVNEEPGEEAPETDQTVPEPTETYGGQPDFKPREILWSSVDAAKRKVSAAKQRRAELIERVRDARLRHKVIERRRDQFTVEARQAILDLEAAEAELQLRAVAAFRSGDSAEAALIGSVGGADHDEVLALRVRQVLLDVALDQDELAIGNYTDLKSRLGHSIEAVVDSLRRSERRIAANVADAEQTAALIAQAEDELLSFEAGSAIYISGVVFPVAQPYDTPLIDSWGFPRMPGTPDEHWHEGIDLFAPSGTPLLAAERGVITRINSGRLGGLTFWLRGVSGADWYYAHLSSYAPGLAVGNVVEPGEVVGFVGNTGNAVSTPSHLHLQLHPGGGDPINPYPLLKVASDRDLAAIAAGGQRRP